MTLPATPDGFPQDPPPPVDLEGVTVRVRGSMRLADVSLSVQGRDFLAVCGPEGSGWDLLIRVIAGLQRPTTGKALVFGYSADAQEPGTVGVVPSAMRFEPPIPLRTRDVVAGGGGTRDAQDAALDRVGLLPLHRARLRDLTAGQVQRLLIARAIVTPPRLLVCADATTGLPAEEAGVVAGLLVALHDAIPVVAVVASRSAVPQEATHIALVNRTVTVRPAAAVTDADWERAHGYSLAAAEAQP